VIAAERTGSNVTTLELFFDLVFVFVITQLSTVLAHDLTWDGVGHVALMLALIWFMYGGYAWLTNAIDVGLPVNRAFLLAGMCGYFVIALAVPQAFGHGAGLAFGVGYCVVVAVHTGLFVTSAPGRAPQAILRLAPGNLGNAALVLVGGAVGGTTQAVLWTASAVAIWVIPKLVGNQDFAVAPAHFVERHGLVIIVAIGESVVAVGIGASGLPVDAELVFFAICGLLLSASLWWTYFGGDDERAEQALAQLPARARATAALDGYGFAHYALLLGIVFAAVGLKSATGHAYDASSAGEAAILAGGAALFLAGHVWFRRVLRIDAGTPARALAAVVVLATIPLGTQVAAIAQVAALAAVVATAATGRLPTAR
jgi:low temperature requirement protein LtrA